MSAIATVVLIKVLAAVFTGATAGKLLTRYVSPKWASGAGAVVGLVVLAAVF